MSEIRHINYVGFTFNGKHSSELGIIRTSEGSRFNESLLPTIQDKTVQVPGGDGMYHFGSYYTQRQFNISYAFDALTEQQLTEIKRVFGDKKIHELIFDEMPFKKYYAKVTGNASIKYIPFAEGETNRVYKGEGSIQFTAYDPYARSVHKFLNQYDDKNKNEWAAASGMKETGEGYDVRVKNGNTINLYNPGVKETDFVLTFNFMDGVIPQGSIYLDTVHQLKFKQIEPQGLGDDKDDQIKINSKLNLLEGYRGGKKSGFIYNNAITSGTFFKIPTGESILTIDKEAGLQLNFESIDYDYIYF